VIRNSVHDETAVDVQNLACDEGRLVGRQEQDGFGDVFRPTQAFQRDGFDDGLALFGWPFGAHFGLDGMRRNTVHVDPVKLGTQKGWSNPASDEYSTFGYPQEIQDFMEAIAMDREPKSGMRVASDTVAALYAAYVSAERKGQEVEVPFDPTLG
jgi:hypothetical protein